MKNSILRIYQAQTPWIPLGLLLLGLLWTSPGLAQTRPSPEADTTEQVKISEKKKSDYFLLPKNPKKATILSAILPGAGQVYNGKIWKVPLLYAGFITDIYFIRFNNKLYQTFREALFRFDNGDNSEFPSLNRRGLVRNVEYWRENRDLTILVLVGIYVLNIVDANVDAHLSGFDVSDDISMKIEPHFDSLSASGPSVGVSLKFYFKP